MVEKDAKKLVTFFELKRRLYRKRDCIKAGINIYYNT
jgi:hypothetical protein